jgi:hypothetical protein
MFFFLSGFRHLVDRWRIQAAVLIFRFHRKEGRARKGFALSLLWASR